MPTLVQSVTEKKDEQILKARVHADQNVEGISILLQINPELYEQIESGIVFPDPDLLKRISSQKV